MRVITARGLRTLLRHPSFVGVTFFSLPVLATLAEYITAWVSAGRDLLAGSDQLINTLGASHSPTSLIFYAVGLLVIILAIHKQALSIAAQAIGGSVAGLVTSFIVSNLALHIPRLFIDGLSMAQLPSDVQSLVYAMPFMTAFSYVIPLILVGLSGFAYSIIYKNVMRMVTKSVT